MEINRTITDVWTITVNEAEVLQRFNDEGIQENSRLAARNLPSIMLSDDDRAIVHRYYCASLAELSAVLARRTTRVGGSIENSGDKMLVTVYTMPMTDNHESELLNSLGSHCMEFLVARLMEKWYGHGSDFGAEAEKNQIRQILHYRRFPIERPFRPL